MGQRVRRNSYVGAVISISRAIIDPEDNINILALSVMQYLKNVRYVDDRMPVHPSDAVLINYAPIALRSCIHTLSSARNSVAHSLGTQLYHDTVNVKSKVIINAAKSILDFESRLRTAESDESRHRVIVEYWGYDREFDSKGNLL